MTNSVDPDQTAPILGSHCLLLYLNSSLMFGNYLQQATLADDIFRCNISWRFKGLFLNVDRNLCGPRREKNFLYGFENNKGADQSALPQWFRNNTTSPNKAVGGGIQTLISCLFSSL